MENTKNLNIESLIPHLRKDLRNQIFQSLQWENIRTLGELSQKTEKEMLQMIGVGNVVVKEIKKALIEFDLTLAEQPAPPKKEPRLIARWQPIETAPKDGTVILAATDEWVATARWCRDHFTMGSVHGLEARAFDLAHQPTHWVYLPWPPEPR